MEAMRTIKQKAAKLIFIALCFFTIMACGGGGGSSSNDTNPATTTNEAPTAIIDSITPNPTVTGQSVSFAGQGSDVDGTITAYEWSSDLDGVLSVNATFNSSTLSAGDHEISLRVQDNDGSWSAAVQQILVIGTPNPANEAPTAIIDSITPNPSVTGNSISFAGQGSDNDGTISAYEWSSSLDGVLSSNATFNSSTLSVGNHEISFRVQDNDGSWSAAVTQNLVINTPPINSVPTASIVSITPNPAVNGNSISFVGQGSDNDGTITAYEWISDIDGVLSANATFSRTLSIGVHAIRFRVRDNDNSWSAVVNRSVTVVAANQAPVANFSANPTGGVNPVLVEFTDLSTGNINSWLWNFGDGATSNAQSPTHQYATAGNYNVSLTVSNGFGSDIETKNNYIQIVGSSVENIYFAIGWGTTYGLWQNLEWDIDDIGAVEISPDVWRYTNQAKGVTYYIRPIDTVAEFENAIREPGAHIIYNGHSNYGYGLGFLLTYQQADVDVFDDPLISNVSTDFTAPSISGLMFGQAFPNWKPEYSWGESAIMPYDFGDPRGLPPYNYYATYTLAGDPTHYRIETADGSYIERFPDSGRPAWYSADGSAPDPVENPEYFITNPDPDFPHVSYVGTWPWASPGDWHVELYNGQTYQYHVSGSGANRATFYVVVPSAGSYNVYATWYPQAANATNTPYRIQHGSLSASTYTTVLANQEVGTELNLLGTFVYNEAGMYTIEVSDQANGTVIADAVQLQYAADPPSYVSSEFSSSVLEGSSPLTVQFINRGMVYIAGVRRPTTTYLWNFGDGTTSTERDPMHTYTASGVYTVSLRTDSQDGSSDIETKQALIHVGTPVPTAPRAQFFARSFAGELPRTASFYDQSKGNVTSWLWNFGDGQTSTEQNPTHTYTTGGAFAVSLTVSGPNGSNMISKADYAYTIVGSRTVDNTDQYKYHYGGIYRGSYSGRAIMDARPVTVPNEQMRYSRFFFNGCVSESYYLPKFTRGVVFYTLDNRDELLDPGSDYIVEYLLGATDDEILEVINSVNYIHGYFDFNNLPPSMR